MGEHPMVENQMATTPTPSRFGDWSVSQGLNRKSRAESTYRTLIGEREGIGHAHLLKVGESFTSHTLSEVRFGFTPVPQWWRN